LRLSFFCKALVPKFFSFAKVNLLISLIARRLNFYFLFFNHLFCYLSLPHSLLYQVEERWRTGISSFYVAFVIAPLASNASELIASYSYALKKTPASISISLQALQGAACMNNTFCLSIFMALIYFQVFAFKLSEVHQLLMQSINMALG